MRTWLLLLGGLIVWAVHFFGLYAAGEIGGHAPAARIAIGLLTLACLAADAGLVLIALRLPSGDGFARWRRSVAPLGAGLSIVAVCWQGATLLAV